MTVQQYSPADVLARMLINAGQASDPLDVDGNGNPVGDFPVYATAEPDMPDDCVTIYNTTGNRGIRSFVDGKVTGPFGFQCRVRAPTHVAAWAQAKKMYDWLTKSLPGAGQGVSVGSFYYVVQSCVNFGDIISVGKETPTSKRTIVTFNAMVNIEYYP